MSSSKSFGKRIGENCSLSLRLSQQLTVQSSKGMVKMPVHIVFYFDVENNVNSQFFHECQLDDAHKTFKDRYTSEQPDCTNGLGQTLQDITACNDFMLSVTLDEVIDPKTCKKVGRYFVYEIKEVPNNPNEKKKIIFSESSDIPLTEQCHVKSFGQKVFSNTTIDKILMTLGGEEKNVVIRSRYELAVFMMDPEKHANLFIK